MNMKTTALPVLLLFVTGIAFAADPPAEKPAAPAPAPAAEGTPKPSEKAKSEDATKADGKAKTDDKAGTDGTAKPDDKAGGDDKAQKERDLGMSILGNQEAPKSLVIVPWKSSELGKGVGIETLLDDSRQPIDKEVFMRVLSYYELTVNTTTAAAAQRRKE